MPKMTDDQEDLRGDIEDALSQFGAIHKALRVIEVRARFLRERTGEKTNTGSINEEIARIRNSLSRIEGIIEQRWKNGQQMGWPMDEHKE